MKILPNNSSLIYSGRIDWSDPFAIVWTYPGTFVKIRFKGTHLSIHVRNKNNYWDNYLGVVEGDAQTKILLPKDGEAEIAIPLQKTEDDIHEVMIFKRQDACHELTILGFEINADTNDNSSDKSRASRNCDSDDSKNAIEKCELLPASPLPPRRIEVYGDSVSAGEVSEALDYIGKADPTDQHGEYSNSWYSYAWITARAFDAQLHDIAQGGAALLDQTGWYHAPDYIGMESIWNKMRYNPDYGTITKWDFSQYTPDIVIVAFGQNDSNPDDYMKKDYEGKKAQNWRAHYEQFLKKIRQTYPNAWIICCTTLLQHDIGWDMSISQAVQNIADKKISHCVFQRNGKATPGHLRIPEAEEMAGELCYHIRSLNIEGYE